jgi:hypothetical protein
MYNWKFNFLSKTVIFVFLNPCSGRLGLSNMKPFIYLFFGRILACLDSDQDSQSEYGSADPTESGFHPDPEHWALVSRSQAVEFF